MIRRLRVRLGVLFVAFFKLLFICLLIIFIYLFIFFAYRKIRKVLTWVQARGPGSSPARVLALVLARVLALVLARILAYGVTNRAYNWCHSYLSGRRQLVCIDGKESSLACVNHGVPQGSILGAFFFILFIKDLPLYITEQGRGSINLPHPLPYPLYHGGGMTLRVRPRVQYGFSSQYIIALRLRWFACVLKSDFELLSRSW